MSVCDGITQFHEDFKIVFKRTLSNIVVPRDSNNFLHRIEKPPILGASQIVNRNNIGMHQIGRHHRFRHEHRLIVIRVAGAGL